MTREEAIKILADLTDNPFLHTWEEQNKALHMAIEALSEPIWDENREIILGVATFDELMDSERKGKWIEMGTNKDGTHSIRCSKCGGGYKTRGHARSIATKAKYKFCPNCGADMRGEQDE